MNSILEQRIWNYLDGNCTEQERQQIAKLIDSDPTYKAFYEEAEQMNADFMLMEADEPSMSFTRNVMDQVKAEPTPGSIKSLIDKRIIYGIAGFFLISLAAVLAYALLNVNWSTESQTTVPKFQVPTVNYSAYLSGGVIKSLIFFNIVIGLFFLDSFLQKKLHHKKVSR
jgi:anti-sigma factor RsiW